MSRHVGSNPTSSAILLMKKALLGYELGRAFLRMWQEFQKATLRKFTKVYVA